MDVSTLLSNLPPGANLFDSIRKEVNSSAFPEPSTSIKIQLWVLLGLHCFILAASVVGIGTRYWKKTAWLFAKDDNGLIRPNTAVASQLMFALYSLCFIITATTYSVKSRATTAAFCFLPISFFPFPLGLAVHFTTWATAVAPATSLRFLSPSAPRPRGITTGTTASIIAIVSMIVFLASIIPATYYLTRSHIEEFNAVDDLLAVLTSAEAANDLSALSNLLPLYSKILAIESKLVVAYRATSGSYGAWLLIWMAVYIPTAIKVLQSLYSRRRRLTRSIRSLRVLDDIVTQDNARDDGEEKGVGHNASLSHHLSPTSVSVSFSTPLPAHIHHPYTPSDSRTQSDDEKSTADIEMQAGGKRMNKRGVDMPPAKTSSRGVAQITDLKVTLAKTNHMLVTILIQFVTMVLMCMAFGTFVILTMAIPATRINELYTQWTGYSFAIPAFFGSTTFAVLSILSLNSRPITPSTPKLDQDATPFGANSDALSMSTRSPAPTSPTLFEKTFSVLGRKNGGTSSQASQAPERGAIRGAGSIMGSIASPTAEEEEELSRPVPAQRWVPSAWAATARLPQRYVEEEEDLEGSYARAY